MSTPSSSLEPHRPAPKAPTLFNGATTHGFTGQKRIRHPWELPLLGVGIAITVLVYAIWFATLVVSVVNLGRGEGWSIFDAAENPDDLGLQIFMILAIVPFVFWISRAIMYGQIRATSVRLSPSQFPEGYRMLVEAAQQFGMRRVPDAYVTLGSGVLNAFASGHGFRRFVVVHSDMFEIGGRVRDPQALRFVIGHEVGHLAAGHVSWLRLVFSYVLGRFPLLGKAYSRAQEYTADNYGHWHCPEGGAGTMAVLSAGKYLNADVNVNELADRAATERGLWLHIANWTSTHPVTTWRAHALRDRSRPGALWVRPRRAVFGTQLPPASSYTRGNPTPAQALAMLNETVRPGQPEQFGRYPGVDYTGRPSIRAQQTSAPAFARTRAPMGPQGPQHPMSGLSAPGTSAMSAPRPDEDPNRWDR